jgi:hypothetical protein
MLACSAVTPVMNGEACAQAIPGVVNAAADQAACSNRVMYRAPVPVLNDQAG